MDHVGLLAIESQHKRNPLVYETCESCGGIWLDKGEVDTIMSIGAKMKSVVDAEKEKAQADLAAMGEVDFNPGLIARFLGMFKKKS